MAKNKGKKGNVMQGRQVTRLPSSAIALAKYHAALSDPFSAGSCGIPTGAPPYTYKGKKMCTISSNRKYFRIRTFATSSIDTVVHIQTSADGTTWESSDALIFQGGVRIVSAGIRWQYTGPRDSIGGSYQSENTDEETVNGGNEQIKPRHLGMLGKVATSIWQPYKLHDLEFSFGNSANDMAEAAARLLHLTVNPHDVTSNHIVDFAVLYESERAPITAVNFVHGQYNMYAPSPTVDAGHHVGVIKDSRKKPVRQGTDRERSAVGHVGHKTYVEHLRDGLKSAGEIMGAGAITVAGYKQLSSAISLGAQVEEDIAVASDMLGYAAPLMLTL